MQIHIFHELADGFHHAHEVADGGAHAANQSSQQHLAAGQLGQGQHGGFVLHLAVHHTACDLQALQLVLLDELVDHLGCGHRVLHAEHESVRAVQQVVGALDAQVLQRDIDQAVLLDAVLHVVLTAVLAQLGRLLHGQTGVAHKRDGFRVLEQLLDLRNLLNLQFTILAHVFHCSCHLLKGSE